MDGRITRQDQIFNELVKQQRAKRTPEERPYIAFHNKGDGDNCIYEGCKLVRVLDDGGDLKDAQFVVNTAQGERTFKLANIQYLEVGY